MSKSQIDHPFQPGVVVAVWFAGGWGLIHPRKTTVLKVHKTGRFVLESYDVQWTPCRWSEGWHARPSRGNDLCAVWSEIHDEALAQIARNQRWRAAVDAFNEMARRFQAKDGDIATLEGLVSRIRGGSK